MDEFKRAEDMKSVRRKPVFSTEAAYVVALITVAFGVAFMEKADWGVSMVVAPAYLVYLKLSPSMPFFTFGMAEYTLQALLLIALIILLKNFRLSYLFSFVTAVLYGFTLDFAMFCVKDLGIEGLLSRGGVYILGMVLCAIGISFFFHSYISPEVYELFVKEVSSHIGMDINRFKTIYDCTSCLLAIVMSFAFFGLWHFEGVKLGTIFCALINGSLIGGISKCLDCCFDFKDAFKLRKYFG